MKILCLLVVVLLAACTNPDRPGKCCIPVDERRNIDSWYALHQKDATSIGIPNLLETKENLHIRFWSEIQAVDVWTDDFKTFYGSLANYATTVDTSYSNKMSEKFYSQIIPLGLGIPQKIYDLFQSLSILKIPAQENIKGWSYGDDGETFSVEYSTKTNYSFKNYWSPSFFSQIKEAVVIDSLCSQLNGMIGLTEKWNKFIKTLPKGCYHEAGILMVCNNVDLSKK